MAPSADREFKFKFIAVHPMRDLSNLVVSLPVMKELGD